MVREGIYYIFEAQEIRDAMPPIYGRYIEEEAEVSRLKHLRGYSYSEPVRSSMNFVTAKFMALYIMDMFSWTRSRQKETKFWDDLYKAFNETELEPDQIREAFKDIGTDVRRIVGEQPENFNILGEMWPIPPKVPKPLVITEVKTHAPEPTKPVNPWRK